MKTIIILFITFMASIFTSSDITVDYDQDCKAELTVNKNRSFKSATEDGASFKLTLTNKSSKLATYTLSSTNRLEPCDNKEGRASAQNNVILNVSIQANTLRAIPSNEITIKSGQSYSFVVNVAVPDGTKLNSWSCIDVEAQSKNCSSTIKTTLSIFVPDPSES
jgi:hypothetical protein